MGKSEGVKGVCYVMACSLTTSDDEVPDGAPDLTPDMLWPDK